MKSINKKLSLPANSFDEIVTYEPIRFNDKELLEIFPEARDIIPEKIAGYEEERKNLVRKIHTFQQFVQEVAEKEKKDEFFVWFWAFAYIKYFHAPKLAEIDRHLFRLKRQQLLFSKNRGNNYNKLEEWNDRKKRAADYPLIEIAEAYLQKVRQTGNRISSLCPFHKEKSPSFFIFLNTNSFICFGCGKKGDSITFLMTIENLNFVEAVRRLSR